MSQQCIDPIVGKILAGWRYDISGLALEMRGDYENHFASCEHCRSRQKIHRIIDVSLIVLASLLGVAVPEEWGGAGLDNVAYALREELDWIAAQRGARVHYLTGPPAHGARDPLAREVRLLGALLGLDVVSFPQAMVSRPIVAATLAASGISIRAAKLAGVGTPG